jgi:hypothetical protein
MELIMGLIANTSSMRVLRVVAGVTAGTLLALLLKDSVAQTPVVHRHGAAPKTAIAADFWYDVADAALIAGDSHYVVVGRVDGTVRIDNDRTVFSVTVTREIKGETPDTILVSQLGKVEGDHRWELEGFPLMAEGRQYVMALAAPSHAEPQDALILLSGAGRGNKIEVAGPEDALVSWYASEVRRARTPYSPGASGHRERVENGQRWERGRPGYRSPGLPAPTG